MAALAATIVWPAGAKASAGGSPAAPVAPEPYAVFATLRLATDPARSRIQFVGQTLALPLGSVTVEVEEQAREAYGAAVRRMFRPATGRAADLSIEVAILSAEPRVEGLAGHAFVEHGVTVRADSGAEIARWTFRGEAPIIGFEQESVVGAFSRAAANAASAFEKEFDGSPAVGTWLAERGVSRRTPVPPAPAPVVAPARLLAYIDVGPGFSDESRLAFAARVGLAGQRFFAALTFERNADKPFVAYPVFSSLKGDGTLSATAIGVDVGVRHRWPSGMELRGGVGGRVVGGPATFIYGVGFPMTLRQTTVTQWAFGGSGFIGFQHVSGPWTSADIRARVGLEARAYAGGSLVYSDYGAEVQGPAALISVFLGMEVPLLQ